MAFLKTAFAAFCLLWPATVVAQDSTEDFFPMEKGTYWIYEGIVALPQSYGGGKALMPVRMEIMENFHKGQVSAALIKGHPADLAWNDGKPGDYLIVRDSDRFYFVQGDAATKAYRELVDQGKHPSEDDIFFVLPLKAGGRACGPDGKGRTDGLYCWLVDGPKSVKLRKVRGIQSRSVRQYELAYRTAPDHTFAYIVPEIGISRWVYSHHGTASDVDVKLIEFHRGSETK
jgi:hypothetical protein